MTRLRSVFAALLIVVAVFLVTHVLRFPGSLPYLMEVTEGREILDQQASFSSEETYQRLGAFGERGRQMYMRTLLTVDIIFPLGVFIFLFLWSRYASEQIGVKSLGYALRGLPVAYLAVDFLENLSVAAMLLNYPERLEFVGDWIGYLTQGKRIAMFGSLLLPGIVLLIATASLLFKQRSPVPSS
jgi:hypothetical protein